MSIPARSFEALNYALRKSRDGIIISLIIHPSDISPELMALPIGARLAITWAEINDDETPKHAPVAETGNAGDTNGGSQPANRSPDAGEASLPGAPSKPRKRFSELRLSAQAGMRSHDQHFGEFMWQCHKDEMHKTYGDVAKAIRSLCDVESRAELDGLASISAQYWRNLNSEYETWLTTQMHAETYR